MLEQSSLYSPLAIVVQGGLVSSTLLARVVTPVLYKLLAPTIEARVEEAALEGALAQAASDEESREGDLPTSPHFHCNFPHAFLRLAPPLARARGRSRVVATPTSPHQSDAGNSA